MTISIAIIYPEILGTYGDRGNALALKYRAEKRNFDCEIIEVMAGEALPTKCDIYMMGGGEDNAQTLATSLLLEQSNALKTITNDSIILAICAGFQILGKQFPSTGSKLCNGLDIIDVTTKPGSPRIIGELSSKCNISGIGMLTGFENHGGRTVLGSNAKALAMVQTGLGNGVELSTGNYCDGYYSNNIIATYMHGPLLARNPILCDHLISKITGIETLTPIVNDTAKILHKERLVSAGK
jgi:CobQ-like glutamine amidotransferase family enzyme